MVSEAPIAASQEVAITKQQGKRVIQELVSHNVKFGRFSSYAGSNPARPTTNPYWKEAPMETLIFILAMFMPAKPVTNPTMSEAAGVTTPKTIDNWRAIDSP